jgi:hypothetical protein
MKILKSTLLFAAVIFFIGCSSSTVVVSTHYSSPHIAPSGTTLLVLRSEYTYVSSSVIFWMVEGSETPVSLSWFIEKYDMHGNKLEETEIGSADSVYLSENEWTICSTSDSVAVLQANDWPSSPHSLLYTISLKSLTGLSDSVEWKNGVIDRDQGRYYVLKRNWSSNVTEVQSIRIQDGTSSSIATLNNSFEYISPSLPVNGTYCVMWGEGVIGRFWFSNVTVQSRPLKSLAGSEASVFCFGDSNIAYVLSPDTVVFSSWQGDSVAPYDTRVLGEAGASDVTLDSAGTMLAYRANRVLSNSGGWHGQGRIVLLDVKTWNPITVCRDSETNE